MNKRLNGSNADARNVDQFAFHLSKRAEMMLVTGDVNNGDIRVDDDSPNAALGMVTGLVVRNYFQRRRRAVAVGVLVAAGA